ncbi:aminotransferase class I/II-fold pyridoxal phosphate-dependent enzyme [Dyadobacter chenwenxiniae]|uniref:Aminotransferase class I/II-fold pyridoxal phosphate-dependent enzyme n=1 Tax=Dyadobacter chenwenxiniae TaxID=2906456 RepID=A0A9X1PR73_9BACT|nr:aminotransferase class I/II-fold pyridoxal phosphate-dependent enzyme [Dyadobacter chenwenxiniae]MCF0065528.1 aminotransferase class I/II-fold pyridoxal phosphate-dependent enzyme [Dyadobacter chenwenxiniae]UON85440.1 aminotransferase class I/II-fold pyridoxal phosphate-dependent enzyme [Dyadobacter chenwenxiniae]
MDKETDTTNWFSAVNSPEYFRTIGYELIDLLARELQIANSPLSEQKAIEWKEPEQMLSHWSDDFSSEQVSDPVTLFKEILSHSINMNRRGNVGHQISAPHPLSVITSMLMAHLNNGMGVYEVGMTGNAMEKIIIEKLVNLFNLPLSATGFVTSGGSLGNLTALLTAKALYLNKSPNTPLDKLAILVSDEAHYSIERAFAIMGIPVQNLIKVPVNSTFQMRTELLEGYYADACNEGKTVFCIVGCSCSTSTGAFDDLTSIALFAKRHDIWFHVDAAHGGPVIFSDRYKYLLEGIEDADSIIMDFHKMMSVPSLSTAVIFAQGWHSSLTFSQNAKYLWQDQQREEWYNSGKRTFECTKPMTVIHVYTLLRVYGQEIFQRQIELQYDLAKSYAKHISQIGHLELLCQPQSNIVCFRYVEINADLNEVNKQIQLAVIKEGTFYIVGTTSNGDYYLRISLMNTRTTLDDLKMLTKIIIRRGRELVKR